MKKLSIYFSVITMLLQLYTIQASAQKADVQLPAKQLMVVLTDNWDTLQGKIYCFNKINDQWVLQFSNDVVVGAKGLGIGDGLLPVPIADAPVKKEGDNKAPAGIFTIGTAFGYADAKDATWIKNHYIKASETLICVDDMYSLYYNTLLKKDTVHSAYKSHEEMHLKKDYYKWGLFINHNAPKTVAGDGSCIFMHIWENSHQGTAGCTAMTEANLLRVLHWINALDNPLLVQLPRAQYVKLKAIYRLPEIAF